MAGEGLLPGVEILVDEEPMAERGRRMLHALMNCRPPGSLVTMSYRGGHRTLMTYGVGHPTRLAARSVHLAAGGRVVMWDLGYFDRDVSMRVAIDSVHPSPEQIRNTAAVPRRAFSLRSDAAEDGPILLIGLGRKSAQMLGLRPLEWEQSKRTELQTRFPGRRILWRPKGKSVVELPGTRLAHGMPIEEALRGCSLVVCRHSNVAIDACIAGVPVECEDGAARALYASGSNPSLAERMEFLHRLSWWNWAPSQAPQAWKWIQRTVG